MSGNEHLVSGWMLNLFDSTLSEFHPKKTPKKQLPVFHFNLKKKQSQFCFRKTQTYILYSEF